jgi:predicted NBD/HSP70 family sugar kinase
MTQPATSSLIRSINRSAVLDLLQQESPQARTSLARRLSMSLPTVMRIVDELIAEDLVRVGRSESTGGRPGALIELNGAGYAVIGVDLGGSKLFGAVTDLSGNLSHETHLPHNGQCAENGLDRLCDLIEQLIEAPRPPGQRLRGIGIGAPGVTRSPEGVVLWSPQLNWRDLPLKDILTRRFGLPVFVENDVNLAALGEWGFGAGRGARSLVLLAVGTGIGAGVVLDGAVYHGAHQAAGEVGYLLPGPDFLGRRYDGFGAFEGIASGLGIAARAEGAFMAGGPARVAEQLTAETVFAEARRGAPWACRIVEETVDYLAVAIADIAAMLDPEIIILGGGVSASADLMVEPILKRLDGVVPYAPQLAASTLGPRAAALGAVTLVLHGTTGRVVINRQF